MASVYQNPTIEHRQPPQRQVETDAQNKPQADKQVRVNDVVISEAEIMAEAQNHPAENPGAAWRKAAKALVIRELLLQEVDRIGIKIDVETDREGRIETQDEAHITALLEQEVYTPFASEEECQRYYETNAEKFYSEAVFEARHILLAAHPESEEARANARADAENLVTHLHKNPGDFAYLAREHSDCPSGLQGGNLGQLHKGSTVPEFERALKGMKAGSTTPEIIESRYGIHLVVLDRHIEGRQLPFEAEQERIRTWLDAATWSRAVSQYISLLAGKSDIQGIEFEAATGALVQ